MEVASLAPICCACYYNILFAGGKSGASYIDFELFRYLEGSFGEAFTKLPATKIGQGSEMMTQFESIKKGFTGQDLKNPFRLSLPALGKRLDSSKVEKSKYDFDDGQVLLSRYETSSSWKNLY